MTREECEIDEREEGEEEEEEEQSPDSETMTDQACSRFEALSLTEPEEENDEKGNEEEEGEQDDQKMTQGIRFGNIFQYVFILMPFTKELFQGRSDIGALTSNLH